MKRLFLFFSLVFGLSIIPVSINVSILSSSTIFNSVSFNTAEAVDDNGCQQLSVKINDGDDGKICPDGEGGLIVAYLKQILMFMSAGVGLIVVLMIVVAGVQYITANGQPENVKKAKARIMNAITALVLFIMAYAILNFVVPGGIFG